MKEKVVLAYSGGLDTTAIIPWLKENYDCEVICCCIDVGQKEELDGLEERAKACGASKLYIKNVVDEYVENLEARVAAALGQFQLFGTLLGGFGLEVVVELAHDGLQIAFEKTVAEGYHEEGEAGEDKYPRDAARRTFGEDRYGEQCIA